MTRCDVLVVGGGPAGSTCAAALVRHGLDTIVLDRASFPRDKVCAGWITPEVVTSLELDLDDYRVTRTLQPFTGFQTSALDGEPIVTDFGRTVSYGIRRCEFDAYLLQRSRARVIDGEPLRTLRRESQDWIANDAIVAKVVVGAGGHFCPVARMLNPEREPAGVVVAQETECAAPAASPVRPELPELFFWPDLCGYGWCVRKGGHLNVGAGRLQAASFPAEVRHFKDVLRARGRVDPDGLGTWKGHAYLLNRTSTRRRHGDAVLLAGDAAGLALAPSGEGILTAVESGAIAADVIRSAWPDVSASRLDAHSRRLEARFGSPARRLPWPAWTLPIAAHLLLRSRWLTRRVLIERAFLHAGSARG
jgi:flavin-dependent dehydrogenase